MSWVTYMNPTIAIFPSFSERDFSGNIFSNLMRNVTRKIYSKIQVISSRTLGAQSPAQCHDGQMQMLVSV